ncbi:hypothetical protein [Ornithinibacillus californiensis]|uniref:hypothetical protein n=1 Tax=Ornithinibacillus californiensis TaxID=161536 RepID=UPI00069D0EF2|nr:hypothetical protein [Ornithinibacillus californiensis]
MNSFEELSETLRVQLTKDRERLHYEKDELIENLWIKETKYLLDLPSQDYPVFKDTDVKVNKYNEAKIR